MENYFNSNQGENDNNQNSEINLLDRNSNYGYDESDNLEDKKTQKVSEVESKRGKKMSKTTSVEKDKLAEVMDRDEHFLTEKLKQQTELYGKLEKQAKSVGRVTFSKMTKEQVELAYDFMLAKEAVERTKRQLEENRANRAEWIGEPKDEEEDKEGNA